MKGMAIQTTITESSLFDPLDDKVRLFSQLPYRSNPYNARNWGHSWHSLCSYPSKLKPSIAHFLIEYFSKAGEVVVDPFCGIGTIPFEACINGRTGIGIDLNPLAFHATNSKVRMPLRKEIAVDLAELRAHISDSPKTVDAVPEEIKSFFHVKTLEEIVSAREFLLTEFDKKPRPSLSFLMTNIAHILHGNRPYALSRRSHNIIPIPPKGDFEYKSVFEHLSERVNRYVTSERPTEFKSGEACLDSVFEFGINDETADCIMTSPPFFGNTEFLRQNRVRIWFCGWDYERQLGQKSRFVESMDLEVYSRIFARFNGLLKNGGLCILHLGVVRERDMALSILPYAENNGFVKHGLIYEDTSKLESHGRTDRGGTHKHQFLILQKAA